MQQRNLLKKMARPERVELPTTKFVARCGIHFAVGALSREF